MYHLAGQYKDELMPLLKYYNWLEESTGTSVMTEYNGKEDGNNTISFPVYDSTLLSFVKEASQSSFMDKNYIYVYTRNRITTPQQEHQLIEKATIMEWQTLCGIFSYYILGGMTKGYLWSQGMQEGVFYALLRKMKEIIEYWDKPL